MRTTIVAGVAAALIAGVVVSIGDASAAPVETTRPTVPAPAPVTAAATSVVAPSDPPLVPVTSVPDRSVGTTETTQAVPPPVADPFGPITSPDVGDHCAAGLDAQDVADFFSRPIGNFQGADYQRALRLPDDRVLWTFQDAFVAGVLVHNVGMIQSGRCFTLLNDGARPWLLADDTVNMHQWHWILGGGMDADGTRIHLFVVQMNELGPAYLNRTRPTALRRVVLDAATLDVVDVVDESIGDVDLYGWGVTSDAGHTYLFSHCYQQFGYDTPFGFGECAFAVKLARVPLGQFEADREYWDGSRWSADPAAATPVVDFFFVGSANNPAQVSFDGTRFILVQKTADWWGTTIDVGVAENPQGPYVHVASIDEPLTCDPGVCNTYFASWVPWRDSNGGLIWSVGHNRWKGSETASHLADYRPTFHAIDLGGQSKR